MASEAHNNAEPKGLFDSEIWERSENLAAGLAEAVAKGIGCDEVHVELLSATNNHKPRAVFTPFGNQGAVGKTAGLFTVTGEGASYGDFAIPLPLSVNDLNRARLPGDLALALSTLGVKSFGVFGITQGANLIGLVACFFIKSFHRWRNDEIIAFKTLGDLIEFSNGEIDEQQIDKTPQNAPLIQSREGAVARYQRLAARGNIVILTTDRYFSVKDIFGNADELFGISSKELIDDPSIWAKLVDPRDAGTLARRIKKLRADHSELQEEVRILHQKTGETRWILLRALPYHDQTGAHLGWEGFGIDVTDRRQAQDALLRQNARLHALFHISKTLSELHDPAIVTLTGLRAVLSATRSEAGYAVFCGEGAVAPEVVAAVGLSEDYLANMDEVLNGPSLLRQSIETRTQFLIPDLQKDPRASLRLAQLERIHSAIITPLVFESRAYGGLVLFKRTPDAYDDDDFELAVSAASQITLAIRQSEVLDLQRRQSASLGSLYSVSRELAKHRGAVDFSDRILPTLKKEFALKRCWIGVTNPQGTHLIGRAGFGSDLTDEAVSTQIEISDDQPILQDVLHSRAPLIFEDIEAEAPEGIISIFFKPQSLVVVPMVTVGQAMGVILLEPLSKQTFNSAERLQLLVSMANEMATAMMAGRFEDKMANSLKMRTAGLLASGVAHNFNNILQAILGQVSLVQLHAKGDQYITQAGHTIQESAMRGAGLVRQLLSFATKGNSRKMPLELAGFFNDSRGLYESLLGSDIALTIDNQLSEKASVYADQSQLQQVMTGMLANSKDALTGQADGEVVISTHSVVVRASELAAELAPGSYIRIDIRDNGLGMTPEQQARCFEPFFTTKGVDRDTGVGLSGSGLGLAAAYATIKEHNGGITVYSREGDGAIFSIYLPSTSTATEFKDGDTRLELSARSGVLMLGVEVGVQPFIASALESLGYAAKGVFDLRQVKELLTEDASSWGAVMVDSDSLSESNRSVCEELGREFPNISIICLAASGTRDASAQLVAEGAQSRVYHIEKPVTGWAIEGVMRMVGDGASQGVAVLPLPT